MNWHVVCMDNIVLSKFLVKPLCFICGGIMEENLSVMYLKGLSNAWNQTKKQDSSEDEKNDNLIQNNNDNNFSNAFKVYLGQGTTGNNISNEANSIASIGNKFADAFSLVSDDGTSTAILKPADEDVVEVEVLDSKRSSYEDKFAVLNEDTSTSKWDILESQTTSDDYSVLDTIGDGLMAAAKIATGLSFGPAKLFHI